MENGGRGADHYAGEENGRNRNVEWPKAERDSSAGEGGDYVRLGDREAEISSEQKQERGSILATPWVVVPVFVMAIVVGGLSGPIILTMRGAGPVSLAGWRHQLSAVILLPGFIYKSMHMPKLDRRRVLLPRNLMLFFLSSSALSAHLALYAWSLYRTSLIHSLFLVCTSPIFVALWVKVSGGTLMKWEVVGVLLGILGVGVLAGGRSVEKDNSTTYLGDFGCLLSAVFMAIYLSVGKSLRSWVPLFVYQFPVALLVAVILAVAGLIFEGWNESLDNGYISGPFSWVRKEYLLGTCLLAIGPGVMGHLGYSFVLKYSSPLVMPTGLSLQPLIGSTAGWAIGESPIPGLWTVLGGAITLVGTLCVSWAGAHRKELKKGEAKDDDNSVSKTDDDAEAQNVKAPLLQQ